ncbi:MAG: hypothetical protein AM325_012425 [Candidatus Thorarchaeota archaeon SMTZ1-45]|nr:MAG: hypothetical protein AM325_14110 [Candidatus Thorarchaeota archaeon SMTZ1-45]
MGHIDRLIKSIISSFKPCPKPRIGPNRRPLRFPLPDNIRSRRKRAQFLAVGMVVLTLAGMSLMSYTWFYLPPLQQTNHKYNINSLIIRTNENGDQLWNYSHIIAMEVSLPDTNAGWVDVVECSDGGLALIAPSLNRKDGITTWSLLLTRLDSRGTLLWTQYYDGFNPELGFSIIESRTGGFVIAGTNRFLDTNTNRWNRDVFLLRTDSNGEKIWLQTYGESKDEWGFSVIECTSGGFALAGMIEVRNMTMDSVLLIRIDEDGTEIWKKIQGMASQDVGLSLVECNDEGFAISGSVQAEGRSDMDVILVRTDLNGNRLWRFVDNQTSNNRGYSLVELNNCEFAITGAMRKPPDYGGGCMDLPRETLLMQVDTNGDLLWNRSLHDKNWEPIAYGGFYLDCWSCSVINPREGGFVLAGTVDTHYTIRDLDMSLFRVDETGYVLWIRTFGLKSWEISSSLVESDSRGFVIAGVQIIPC